MRKPPGRSERRSDRSRENPCPHASVSPPIYTCRCRRPFAWYSSRLSIPEWGLGSHLTSQALPDAVRWAHAYLGSNHAGQQRQRRAIAIRTGPTERRDYARQGTERHLYFGLGQADADACVGTRTRPEPVVEFLTTLWLLFPQKQGTSTTIHQPGIAKTLYQNGWFAKRTRPSRALEEPTTSSPAENRFFSGLFAG